MPAATRRAVGLVRVSHVGDRNGDQYVSPKVQTEQLERRCKADGLRLLEVHDEQDVSGGAQLDRRPGLSACLEAIESGRADVLIASNFDRLFRSVKVQQEVVERVEARGGEVLAVDTGRVSNGTAGQWVSSTMLGVVAEYVRRSTGERSRSAVVNRVAAGAVPYKVCTPGLGTDSSGRLVVTDQSALDVVERALEMRAAGKSFAECRDYLRANGIRRSLHGTQTLLRDKLLVGWVKFGELENRNAAEPFVNPETWRKANERTTKRGKRSPSDALLARLGVLRCGSCGSAMIVGNGGTKDARIRTYRCATMSTGDDCPARASITAAIADKVVADATIAACAGLEGRASAVEEANAAQDAADAAQAKLDGLIAGYTAAGVLGEPSAVAQLEQVRRERDDARALAERLTAATASRLVTADDWPDLSLEARRELIRTTIASATVAPSAPGLVGADRITVQVVGE